MSDQELFTRRQWLVLVAVASGANPFAAQEAVASVALEHPEWDMDEQRTFLEWRTRPHYLSESATLDEAGL